MDLVVHIDLLSKRNLRAVKKVDTEDALLKIAEVLQLKSVESFFEHLNA